MERQLEGRESELKESTIGVEVYGRRPDYDPKLDSTVRNEVMRLRARLSKYYSTEGSQDPLVIELPKGGYVPGFQQPDTKPPVEVEDAKWKAAPKQLRDFEILGEDERPTDAVPRYFKVKLTMISGPPQEVRYVVFGIDPLHVYREQDYDKLSGAGK